MSSVVSSSNPSLSTHLYFLIPVIHFCNDLETNISRNDHSLNDLIFEYVRNPIWDKISQQIQKIRRYIGITQNRSVYGMYFQSLFNELITKDITDIPDKWHHFITGARINNEVMIGINYRNKVKIGRSPMSQIQGIMITYCHSIIHNQSIFIYHCQNCGCSLRPTVDLDPGHIDQSNHFMTCENSECSQIIVFR